MFNVRIWHTEHCLGFRSWLLGVQDSVGNLRSMHRVCIRSVTGHYQMGYYMSVRTGRDGLYAIVILRDP